MAIGNKVKGITIEFNGDTTKLGKAIKDIDSNTRSLDKDLKAVDRALKFNPTNTELLAQKQKLLGDKVNETKTKLDALKAAQAKLDDDPAVDNTSKDYMELQREIIETESKLNHFKGEAEKLANVKMTALGKQFEQVGGKMKGVGDSMTRNVSAPLAGVGAAAVKIGLDFDAEMSKVAAIAGATGKDFDALRNKAREMGSKTKFSATEAGQGLEYMAMAGWGTKDMLDGIEPVLNLAAASGEDLGTTSDIVTDAMTAFGLKAKDAGHFADVLAQASSNANTNVGMMGETFKYAAPVAGALGYSIEDVGLGIGLMANSGIKASNAGTALRSIMTRLASPTKQSATAMEQLGLSLTNSDGSMKSFRDIMIECREKMAGMNEEQKTQIAANLAGKNAMSGFLAIVNASDKDFDKLANSIDNCDGATDRMSATMMNNTKGGITTMISALQNAAIAISDVLSPWITKLAMKVEELANKFSNLSPQAQKAIIMFAGLVAAMGPILSIGGRLLIGIGMMMQNGAAIIGLFGKIGGAFKALGAVLSANPWVLITAAAIAAIVLIYKNWDKIKEFFAKLWEAIKVVAKAAWDRIKAMFKAVFEAIKLVITTYINIWKKIITTVFNFLKTYFTTIFNAYKKIFKTAFNIIKDYIVTPIKNAKDKVTEIIGGLKDKFSEIFDSIKQKAADKFKAIKDAIIGPIKTARDKVKEIIDKIKGFFDFDFKLPHIKLPHFSVQPPGWQLGDLLQGVIPSLDIDWYAKGGIFRSPRVVGVGEKGPEAVLPISRLESMMVSMAQSIVEGISGGGMEGAVINTYVQIDGKTVGKAVTPVVNRGMYDRAVLDGRNA